MISSGLAFLGAIARGYFDHSADIDIALFKKKASEISINKFLRIDDIEVHCWLSDYESELTDNGICQNVGHIHKG